MSSKIAELTKLIEQAEELKRSIKPEDLETEIAEVVKQLDIAGKLFETVNQYCPDLGTHEKIQVALGVFKKALEVKTPRNKIPSVEALSTFLGTEEKTKSQIAEHFKVTSAHVNSFLTKNKDSFVARAEDKNNRLSKKFYSVKPKRK